MVAPSARKRMHFRDMLASDGPDVAWCAMRLHSTSRDGRGIEKAKTVSPDTTGQISGTERLFGAVEPTRLGLGKREPVFEKAAPTKTAQPHARLGGSKAELTGNSRLYPLPPLDNGESHQSPADQQQGNRLGHSDVKLPGKRTPNGSARIDDSFNLQGTFVVDLRRERTAPKREGANRIGDSPVCVQ